MRINRTHVILYEIRLIDEELPHQVKRAAFPVSRRQDELERQPVLYFLADHHRPLLVRDIPRTFMGWAAALYDGDRGDLERQLTVRLRRLR